MKYDKGLYGTMRYVEREWYDCCSSMDKVSRGRSYRQWDYCSLMDECLEASHTDCCSSMDECLRASHADCCSWMDECLGAGPLSTWIREIFLKIS